MALTWSDVNSLSSFRSLLLVSICSLNGWALWGGVEVEFLPQNFWIGFPSTGYLGLPFCNMQVWFGVIMFEMRHIRVIHNILDVSASCACVRSHHFYDEKKTLCWHCMHTQRALTFAWNQWSDSFWSIVLSFFNQGTVELSLLGSMGHLVLIYHFL